MLAKAATQSNPKPVDLDFRRQAFLAALTGIMTNNGWNRGGKSMTLIEDRVSLAWEAADYAIEQEFMP